MGSSKSSLATAHVTNSRSSLNKTAQSLILRGTADNITSSFGLEEIKKQASESKRWHSELEADGM